MKRYVGKPGRCINYGKQSVGDDDIQAVTDALRQDRITQGPIIGKFEESLCRYTGAKYAVCVSSGTAGLHIACLAAGISEGDEVIIPTITFVATANSTVYCGAKAVFADVQEDTVNIDPEEIKRRINKKTKAIIPVHFAGHPVDLYGIYKIAKSKGATVIEDATHALGAEYKNVKIGSCRYSDMTVLSFHPVKHITTGEGGAVLTNSKKIYETLILLKNHGITKDKSKFIKPAGCLTGDWYYEMQGLGFNYRITDFQCALGISQLKKLGQFVKRRREIVAVYNKEFSDIKSIILPTEREYVKSSCHIYCIRLKDSSKRKSVFDKLRNTGIYVQVHYIPVHLQPYYRDKFGYNIGDYPISEDYYRRAITLPLYPSMRDSDIKYVVKTLKNILK